MLTLLGSLLGFGSSFLPEVMKFFREKADRAHEYAMTQLTMEAQRQGAAQRLEEINVQADIAESMALYKSAAPVGVAWVDALSGTVRPVITYAFFGLFAAVKGTGLYGLIALEGVMLDAALAQIWDGETAALFAAVMSFWFGARSMAKLRGR